MASALAKCDVKDELTQAAQTALTNLDVAFRKESHPAGLDLAITGGQGASIVSMLQTNASQAFLTTHSPATLSAASEIDVLVCGPCGRYLRNQTGLRDGQGGALTLIQGFGSAANLNIHLHCRCSMVCTGATVAVTPNPVCVAPEGGLMF